MKQSFPQSVTRREMLKMIRYLVLALLVPASLSMVPALPKSSGHGIPGISRTGGLFASSYGGSAGQQGPPKGVFQHVGLGGNTIPDKPCELPKANSIYQNATFDNPENRQSIPHGKTLTFTCRKGYKSNDAGKSTNVECNQGNWQKKSSSWQCRLVTCGDLPTVANSGRNPDNQKTYNTKVTYKCNDGYEMRGTGNVAVCLETGKWSTVSISCVAVECGDASSTAVPNAALETEDYGRTYKSEVNYVCKLGYKLVGDPIVYQCNSDKKWKASGAAGKCLVIKCSAPPRLTDGTPSSQRTEYNTKITYKCKSNYGMKGTGSTIVCQRDGTWSRLSVSCVAQCNPPPVIANSQQSPKTTGRVDVGTKVIYTCETGSKKMCGDATRTCQSDHKWSGKNINCKKGKVVEMARGKPTRQDSTRSAGQSYKAVDGNPSPYRHRQKSCTHTRDPGHATPWWYVDIGTEEEIVYVTLVNRAEGYGYRLRNFDIVTETKPFGGGNDFIRAGLSSSKRCYRHSGSLGNGKTMNFTMSSQCKGRYVGVYIRGTSRRREILSLCEVYVHARVYFDNVAKGKLTNMSSTYSYYYSPSQNAVDGIWFSSYHLRSCVHTGYDKQAWWLVDLGKLSTVRQIIIVNRGDCCGNRLARFDVFVTSSASVLPLRSRTGSNRLYTFTGTARNGQIFHIDGKDTQARKVGVQLQGSNYLQLCEVEVRCI